MWIHAKACLGVLSALGCFEAQRRSEVCRGDLYSGGAAVLHRGFYFGNHYYDPILGVFATAMIVAYVMVFGGT